MESDQRQKKHRCNICRKSFSSGRSLGGHMRSHIHSSSSGAQEKEKLDESRDQEGWGIGYGLRNNPKKTFKLSDLVGEDLARSSKRCRECGKEFPSWKSLFGHMRCHSQKTSYSRSLGKEESWVQKKNSHQTFSNENESEQQVGALILMMLSRDIGSFSDKISEEDFGDDLKRRLILNPLVLEKKRAMVGDNGCPINEFTVLSSRYKCLTCCKGFHSYHALGGHRASHKRIRNCCRESHSFDTEASIKKLGMVYQKSRIHECDVCGKIFSSGQALGGHKRSHLVSNIGSEGGGGDNQTFLVEQFSEPLDLNLLRIEQFEGFVGRS